MAIGGEGELRMGYRRSLIVSFDFVAVKKPSDRRFWLPGYVTVDPDGLTAERVEIG